MKKLFIPATSKYEFDLNVKEVSKKLPKKILIAYSIQYEKTAQKLKKVLSRYHKILGLIQVLGCSKPKIPTETQAILLISSGKFHAISLAYEKKIPIYLLEQNNLLLISKKEIEEFEKNKKISLLNFLNAKSVGVFISTKSGQEKLKKISEIKNKFNNKKIYFFLANNFNNFEMENFPQIQSWINTACPRIDLMNSKILNINELKILRNI